ncbi:hypothetical protein [Aminobacter sp. BE322]|uniref:hypothetical protein n=1 Tax=unclassified Aminobacter TaxID=2644704 RepID=UPI003D208BB5
MKDLVLLSFVLVFVVLVLVEIRKRRLGQAASAWPEADAKIVERIFVASDPSEHDVVVSYTHGGREYQARAENFYSVDTESMWPGEVVRIKIDPGRPERCVVYQRIERPVWLGPSGGWSLRRLLRNS